MMVTTATKEQEQQEDNGKPSLGITFEDRGLSAFCDVQCVICGCRTDSGPGKTPVAIFGSEQVGDVCEDCVAVGAEGIRARVLKGAQAMLYNANELITWASLPVCCDISLDEARAERTKGEAAQEGVTVDEYKRHRAEQEKRWEAKREKVKRENPPQPVDGIPF